ncbi:MAG TPA: CBS domain-containing protein [Acidisphaera sp.]|nr:CBS domain-containing protein [Acidisphaera sp.]
MLAKDVMTWNVVTARPEHTVLSTVRKMIDHGISGMPVIDASRHVVGILSEADLLRRSELGTEKPRSAWRRFIAGPGKLAEDYVRTHGRKVGEIMTTPVETVTETASLEDIVATMEKRHIKRVPVVRDGKLIGIVSRMDILRAFTEHLMEDVSAPAGKVSDFDLTHAVERAIAHVPGHHRLTIEVEDAVVTLDGVIFDNRERKALVVATENVPGVKEVKDNIAYIEPATAMMPGGGPIGV